MVYKEKSLQRFFCTLTLKKQTKKNPKQNKASTPKLCVLSNLKKVCGWNEMSIYKTTSITEIMTDGSTCGTKAI